MRNLSARRAAGTPALPEEDAGRVLAILQSNTRRGPWHPPERMQVVSVLGSVVLDYREAELPDGVTEVDCAVYLGSVEIRVPADVEVELTGSVLLGSVESREDAELLAARERIGAGAARETQTPPASERPLLSVDCTGVLGSVEVRLG